MPTNRQLAEVREHAIRAAKTMPIVESTVHVTVAECLEHLRRANWCESVIAKLFEGATPDRVQVGSLMLVIKQ